MAGAYEREAIRPYVLGRFADLLLAGSLLVPLALYIVYSTGEVRLRHFSLALPWVMLAAALALHKISSYARRYNDRALATGLAVHTLLADPRLVADVANSPRSA